MDYLGEWVGGGPGHSWAQMALARHSKSDIFLRFIFVIFMKKFGIIRKKIFYYGSSSYFSLQEEGKLFFGYQKTAFPCVKESQPAGYRRHPHPSTSRYRTFYTCWTASVIHKCEIYSRESLAGGGGGGGCDLRNSANLIRR
jgi:hypothetical protein